MMRMAKWAAMAAVGVLASAGSASADVLVYSASDVVPSWRAAGVFMLPLLDATTYELTFAPQATPLWINQDAMTRLDYDNYAENGQWLGGEGLAGTLPFPWFEHNGVYTGTFTTPRDLTTYWDNGRVKRTEVWDTYLTFEGVFAPEDVGTPYTFTLVSVPEPATWLLMITGFGMAGAALRRRALASG